MDTAGVAWDRFFSRRMGTIRTPYLEDANYERRMNVLRQFVRDGLGSVSA